jgi:hypothetical protein
VATTDVESYLNQLVGRTVRIKQYGDSDLYLNVLALNGIGLLVQDSSYEYFIPWAAISNLRIASDEETLKIGSPELRRPQVRPVLQPER